MKIKFFFGSPPSIEQEFADWQKGQRVKLVETKHAISAFVAPMSPVAMPGGVSNVGAGQLVTIICLMVLYEDIAGNTP